MNTYLNINMYYLNGHVFKYVYVLIHTHRHFGFLFFLEIIMFFFLLLFTFIVSTNFFKLSIIFLFLPYF